MKTPAQARAALSHPDIDEDDFSSMLYEESVREALERVLCKFPDDEFMFAPDEEDL